MALGGRGAVPWALEYHHVVVKRCQRWVLDGHHVVVKRCQRWVLDGHHVVVKTRTRLVFDDRNGVAKTFDARAGDTMFTKTGVTATRRTTGRGSPEHGAHPGRFSPRHDAHPDALHHNVVAPQSPGFGPHAARCGGRTLGMRAAQDNAP